ncbi:M1 family metallopeptidase [Mucilaginibacter myungsuensis]|uniref:Aminopeptidase N n=1 Tax=Mucilaginibacter myungsuensis TaxID=649104 RepID=A0A929KY30_9SPHI|nr:M1 family metallopeptidase [Mucilaginibacter myungsuensis]MBE9662635.1 M1 family metallopeptidase [Mucilaginibacter myungsuensis]MDN3598055.1 M1 family metallopeptidase [Mucilaginibacter myungsuensis]
MKKLYALVFLFAPFIVIAQKQSFTSGGKLKPEQAIMDIRHYTIALDVDVDQKLINGHATIDVVMGKPTKTLLLDLLDSFKISKVLVNNTPQSFKYENDLITIDLKNELPAGKAAIQVFYGGKPHIARRPPWDDGFSWAKDSKGTPRVEITAEGTGGKLYFPCKDHPSDEANEGVDMIITVPKALVVAGPGLLVKTFKNGDKATYHWKTRYGINNYSIVFNAADYTVVSRPYKTIDGNTVPIQFYVLKENVDKAEHHLDVFEKTIRQQEKYFGEYPWVKEKIGIVETAHLGMEHQSMNAYGNKFKYTKVGGEDHDGLMHHELGHEWWGNKVTANDWADMWIHEGIGTYGDALYIKDLEGDQAYINYFKRSALGIRSAKPLIMGKDIDEETAYNGEIYSKGAFFMHTLCYVMGEDVFFPALKKFATDPRYTYDNIINTHDVEQYFSSVYGKSIKPLFNLYLYTTNKLEVTVKPGSNDRYSIQLTNIDMPLPVDITTDSGTQKVVLSKTPTVITSKTMPVIDKDAYYLKKITID